MHPNPAFRREDVARHIAFARDRAFGTLCINADDGPLLSHVPFLVNEDATSADLHLVRSNPIARMGEVKAVIAVQGPDTYISPDWYETPDQVPTWNYVAVHLRGTLTPLPPEDMHDMLDRQSAAYEHRLFPKTPWTTGKMTPDVLQKMMRQILPFRFFIDKIDGTWKLGQNKSEAARKEAAEKVETDGIGHEVAKLAALMKDADPKP